jgi:hypothetical protein
MSSAEIDKIIRRVKEDFAAFDVVITTDEMTYRLTNPKKRMRVIITESYEWYGVTGGVAFYDSFTWGNDTPCFIFSTLLSYNEKHIAEAISHEVGHTFGLRHQSSFDAGCNRIAELNDGTGEGEISWAPIMGLGYYKNVTTWHKGPAENCNTIQDDVAIIASIVGTKKDETISFETAAEVETKSNGVINSNGDVDYYYVELKSPKTISASPNCIGNDVGANMHLKLLVYEKNGNDRFEIVNPKLLTAKSVLEKGKYYIAVQTTDNSNQSRYGMLGSYELSLN